MNCNSKPISKTFVLPVELINAQIEKKFVDIENKCCLTFSLNFNEVKHKKLSICSLQNIDYKCNLEVKYIQLFFASHCADALEHSIKAIFMANSNINDFMQASIFF